MPAMDTTRDRVEAEVGLSLLSLAPHHAPHIDSSFVIYDLSGAQETAFEPLRLHLKPVDRGRGRAPADFIRQLGN